MRTITILMSSNILNSRDPTRATWLGSLSIPRIARECDSTGSYLGYKRAMTNIHHIILYVATEYRLKETS